MSIKNAFVRDWIKSFNIFKMENCSYHKLEDFILSESFRDYVVGNDEDAIVFWNNWVVEHPEQKDEFNKAKTILNVLLGAKKRLVTIDKNEALDDLIAKIKTEDRRKQQKIKLHTIPWLKVAGVLLILISIGIVWKSSFNPKSSSDTAQYQIIVPIGEKSQIILPDGTHVWINSGSRFTYPAKYGIDNRVVYLDGEAYFDVTKKKGMPFIVNTKDVKIKVFGTAFNVKGYASDKTVETTVVRGLVRVESAKDCNNSIFVNPNEKAVYMKSNQQLESQAQAIAKPAAKSVAKIEDKDSRPILVLKTNPEPITCWKDQLLVFTDETFEDIVVKMERWYDIKINVTDSSLKQERFNGKFVHNETVYQVLEAIKLTTPINYKLINNEINITRKSNF